MEVGRRWTQLACQYYHHRQFISSPCVTAAVHGVGLSRAYCTVCRSPCNRVMRVRYIALDAVCRAVCRCTTVVLIATVRMQINPKYPRNSARIKPVGLLPVPDSAFFANPHLLSLRLIFCRSCRRRSSTKRWRRRSGAKFWKVSTLPST